MYSRIGPFIFGIISVGSVKHMHSGPLFELSGGWCISAIIYIAVLCAQATFAISHDFFSSFLTFCERLLREMLGLFILIRTVVQAAFNVF
jgi:hypothetical protein